jgi:hypothetical protein
MDSIKKDKLLSKMWRSELATGQAVNKASLLINFWNSTLNQDPRILQECWEHLAHIFSRKVGENIFITVKEYPKFCDVYTHHEFDPSIKPSSVLIQSRIMGDSKVALFCNEWNFQQLLINAKNSYESEGICNMVWIPVDDPWIHLLDISYINYQFELYENKHDPWISYDAYFLLDFAKI